MSQSVLIRQHQCLTVVLDDEILYDNKDLYIQIISKHLALERFYCYHKVQKLLRNKKKLSMTSFNTIGTSVTAFLDGNQVNTSQRNEGSTVVSQHESHIQKSLRPTAHEIEIIRNQVDYRQIYTDVFDLFGVRYWIDPILSVKKLTLYHQKKSSVVKPSSFLDVRSEGAEST